VEDPQGEVSPFPALDEEAWRARVEASGVSLDALRSVIVDGPVVEPLYPPAPAVPPAWTRTGPWAVAQAWPLHPAGELVDVLAQADDLELAWIDCPARLDAGRDTAALALVVAAVAPRPLFVQAGVPQGASEVMRAAAAQARIDLRALAGGLVADPVGQLARDGGLAVAVDDAIAGLGAARTFALAQAPMLRTVLACGLPWHDAGASAVDELAAVLSTALAYVRAHESAADGLGALVLRVGLGGDVLVDVAKIRALRWLVLGVARRLGAPQLGATVPIHAHSGRRTRSRADADTNLVRATVEAFAAAIGGADAIAIAPHDGGVGSSARWARNVSHLLRHEAHLDAVADPTAGSGAIEALTEALARAAWTRVQAIEAGGGVVAGLRSGELQARVAATASMRGDAVALGKTPLVGISKFAVRADPSRVVTLREAAAIDPASWVERVDPLLPLSLAARFEKGGAS
jgi:methylmalonyl-CoA mutase